MKGYYRKDYFVETKLFKAGEFYSKELTSHFKTLKNTWKFAGRAWSNSGKILEFCWF